MYELIKKYEGCKLTAYKCPAGVITIGYGTTVYPNGQKVQMGDKITKKQAEEYLADYCQKIKLPKGCFTSDQKEALYSLIYNIGQGAFDRSACKKAIEACDWKKAYNNWDWVKAGGKTLRGLVLRRNEEKNLFFDGLL